MNKPIKIRRGKDLNIKGTAQFTIKTKKFHGNPVIIGVDIKVLRNRKIRVVFTETPANDKTPRPTANKGTSVTSVYEQLANELVKSMPRIFSKVSVENITWYERYMSCGDPIVSRSVDRVRMDYIPNIGFMNPEWYPIWHNQHGTMI